MSKEGSPRQENPHMDALADLEEVAMFDQANLLKIQKHSETAKKKGNKKKSPTRGGAKPK